MKNNELIEEAGNQVIFLGSANHFLNGEAVGGKLYLLPGKLWFKSHSFNFQNHELTMALDEITEIGFYNTLGLIPNGLQVKKSDNSIEKFVVYKRKQWKQEIIKLNNNII